MNKFIIPLVVVLVILGGIFLISQGGDSIENNIETGSENDNGTDTTIGAGEIPFAGELFVLSSGESLINWIGRKSVVSGYIDTGTINFQGGQFFVEDKLLTGGRAVFDMNSIKVLSTGVLSGEVTLEEFLKSDNFFTVEKYPTAELFITGVKSGQETNQFILSGELTMKGISQGVSFPATVIVEDGKVMIEGETQLDRTLWDIKFGSDKFFDNLADNVIDDFFTVGFKVVAEVEE